MLVRVAWRNIWRNKTRSFVVIVAITVGLWGGIFSYAFMKGMGNQQIYSTIHIETGHIQINQPGFMLNYDLQSCIANGDSIEQVLNRMQHVKAVTSKIEISAMASSEYSSTGVVVNGIDTGTFQRVSKLAGYLKKGSFFEGKKDSLIVIGEQLADKLHVNVNSKITLTMQCYNGAYIEHIFTINGIYKLSNSDFNEQMVFVTKSDIRKIIGLPQNRVSAINILLDNDEHTQKVKDEISRKYGGLQVQSWQQLSPMVQIMSGTINQMTSIFVFIILLALSFSIINTMLMAVMDRTREIGMLLCIGMSSRKVFAMIVLETLFLSFTGVILGLTISLITVQYTGIKGVDISFISQGINAVGLSSHIYPVIDKEFYPQFASMVILITLFSSYFPAKRAMRLKPAEAVRAE